VFDPVTKRCFGVKINNYIDISYNMQYGDIIVSDIFGIEKDTTAVMNFDIDFAKVDEFGDKLKVNPALFNVTVLDGEENQFSYTYTNMPQLHRRKFYVSAPFPGTKQLKVKVNIQTMDVADFRHFILRNFRYSLQKKQNGKKLDMFFNDDVKANKKVDASYIDHKPTIPDKEAFDNYMTFNIGTTVPDEFLYSEMNERDEMNGNWIQTWFKIGPKPEFKDETTMINIHGWKECSKEGGCEFQHRVTYNYANKKL